MRISHFWSYLSQMWMDFTSIWVILKLGNIVICTRTERTKSPKCKSSGSDHRNQPGGLKLCPDRGNNESVLFISCCKTHLQYLILPGVLHDLNNGVVDLVGRGKWPERLAESLRGHDGRVVVLIERALVCYSVMSWDFTAAISTHESTTYLKLSLCTTENTRSEGNPRARATHQPGQKVAGLLFKKFAMLWARATPRPHLLYN